MWIIMLHTMPFFRRSERPLYNRQEILFKDESQGRLSLINVSYREVQCPEVKSCAPSHAIFYQNYIPFSYMIKICTLFSNIPQRKAKDAEKIIPYGVSLIPL